MARAGVSRLLLLTAMLACCGAASARDGPIALKAGTNSSQAGGRRLLNTYGSSCAEPINLAGYTSPLVDHYSTDKTNFAVCGSGYAAVFYYSLPPGLTITFSTPSSVLFNTHTNHEIRYDGSCPGSSQATCDGEYYDVGIENNRDTYMDVYYTQSGFFSADSDLNVQWTVTSAAVGSFSVTSGPCTVDSSGTCFFSPNYPSTYDLYDSCTISVLEAVTLSVVAFDLYTFDSLYVGWNEYSGTDGPDGEQVNSILSISFTSSGWGTSSGFKICSGSTGSASPTATNTIEMNSAYQACLTSPSTCTNLWLSYNGLAGTLPTELGTLTALTVMDIEENSLTSTVPTELGSLTALSRLSLHANSLTGALPTQLGALAALTDLTVYNNAGLCGSVVPLSSGRMYFTWNTALGTDCLTGSPIVSTATPTMTPSVAPTTSPTTAAPSATPTAVTVSPTVSPSQAPTAPVYTVSSITSFSALDISEFDDTTFNTSFRATFQSQLASYAGVDADNVAIVSIESGSVQVESELTTTSSAAAATLASGLSDDISAVFTDASFTSYGTIGVVSVSSNSTAPARSTTLLHLAAGEGRTATVEALLAKGADANIQDLDGKTALYMASEKGHTTIAVALLAAEADANIPAENGVTPLHMAAQNGHIAITEALIAAGANVNSKAADEWTPLHLAAGRGHIVIVEALLATNADVNPLNEDGKTALQLARRGAHREITELLLAAGAGEVQR